MALAVSLTPPSGVDDCCFETVEAREIDDVRECEALALGWLDETVEVLIPDPVRAEAGVVVLVWDTPPSYVEVCTLVSDCAADFVEDAVDFRVRLDERSRDAVPVAGGRSVVVEAGERVDVRGCVGLPPKVCVGERRAVALGVHTGVGVREL